MTTQLKFRPLKICSTCRYWSYKYKGLCSRLNQGVGKFWACEKWLAAADLPPAASPAVRGHEPHGSLTTEG